MPVSFSRRTRFILSIFTCIFLNNGIILRASSMMTAARTGMATASTMVSGLSFENARIIPPIAIIGALIIMRVMIIVTICTWVISFVVLVISVAVPILSNSCSE